MCGRVYFVFSILTAGEVPLEMAEKHSENPGPVLTIFLENTGLWGIMGHRMVAEDINL